MEDSNFIKETISKFTDDLIVTNDSRKAKALSSVVNSLRSLELLINGKARDTYANDVLCYVHENELNSKLKDRPSMHKRSYLCWFLRKISNDSLSYPEIGRIFNRDHATVIHCVRKASMWLEDNDELFLNDTVEERALFNEDNYSDVLSLKNNVIISHLTTPYLFKIDKVMKERKVSRTLLFKQLIDEALERS